MQNNNNIDRNHFPWPTDPSQKQTVQQTQNILLPLCSLNNNTSKYFTCCCKLLDKPPFTRTCAGKKYLKSKICIWKVIKRTKKKLSSQRTEFRLETNLHLNRNMYEHIFSGSCTIIVRTKSYFYYKNIK